jgi:membrane-bound serine protease (ClpP class)
MNIIYKLFIIIFINVLLNSSSNAQTKPIATLLEINGAIGPTTQDYIHRGLEQSAQLGAKVAIIKLDTPGGLDTSMRMIIKDILSSAIPVATFVAPSGARAASAGTYILYASHIAAMAPGTNLGAATPVSLGGITPLGEDNKDKKNHDPMTIKITNDAIAYIKSLAELRGRNAVWAEKAVREGASLSAEEALKLNVINLIAKDISNLLIKMDDMKVTIQDQTITLHTKMIDVIQIQADWRTKILAVITDPNVAYILLLLGIYGLFFEFMSPGYVLPGVVGGISLLLALYALQLLPINYAGLALIILGICFLAAEAFIPSGALGIGGLIAFVAGSILLLDPNAIGYHLNLTLIFTMALLNLIFFIIIIRMILKIRKKQIVTGREELINMVGIAEENFVKHGWIIIHGERWEAISKVPIKAGEKVSVKEVDGLLLRVEPINNGEK